MKHGILFEVNGIKKHSYEDFGLLLVSFEKSLPEIKTNYIKIEGSDGDIDLTEAFGRVNYEPRSFAISFECSDIVRYDGTWNKLVQYLHGRVGKLTEWCDDGYYYSNARITLDPYTSSKAKGSITIQVKADAYKLHQKPTIHNLYVDGKIIQHFNNDRMECLPSFVASNEMMVKYKGNTYSVGTSEKYIADIVFQEGDNVLEFVGLGMVTVKYQEGAL